MIYRQNFTFYQKKTGFACLIRQRLWPLFMIMALALGPFQHALAQGPLSLTPSQIAFPEGRLATSDGRGFAVSDYQGKAGLLINFWASWCAPCITELPELVEASHLLAEKGVVVVLVNVDRKGQAHATDFLKERDISVAGVISAFNPEADWPRALQLRGLPSTYFIDKNSGDRHVIFGPEPWADEDVIAQIAALIGN